MAVETRIGLVVGLGFITCFAVVLSHRGAGDRLSARVAYDLLAKQGLENQEEPAASPEPYLRRSAREGRGEESSPERQPAPSAREKAKDGKPFKDARRGRTAAGSASARRSGRVVDGNRTKPKGQLSKNKSRAYRNSSAKDRRSARSQGRTRPSSRSRQGKLPGRKSHAVARGNEQTHPEKSGKRRTMPGKRVDSSPQAASKKSPSFEELFGGAAGGDEAEKDAKRRAVMEASSDVEPARGAKPPPRTERKDPTERTDAQSPEHAKTPPGTGSSLPNKKAKAAVQPPDSAPKAPQRKTKRAAPQPGPARYVVQPRDTLWRIAEQVYGVRSLKIVDAIFAANRDRLTSRDQLRVGVELALPRVDGVAPATGKADKTQVRARDDRPSREPSRYYQIQRGDRYTTIAERLLGSKSRWREIHALNKDIFPDPGKIRSGVRIRLPSPG